MLTAQMIFPNGISNEAAVYRDKVLLFQPEHLAMKAGMPESSSGHRAPTYSHR